MAFPIPSFLQFAPPEAVLGDLANQRERTTARQQGNEINLMELGLRRQQLGQQRDAQAADQAARNQELEFKTFALMNNMTSDQAKLALEQQKADQEAQIAATQFQGNQNLQRDLAAGLPFEQAFQRNAPLLLFGNPAALGNFANTLNRTQTQSEIADLKAANTLENTALRNEFGMELGKLRTEAATKLEEDRQKNRMELLKTKLDSMSKKLNPVDQGIFNTKKQNILMSNMKEEEREAALNALELEYMSKLGSGDRTGVRRFNRQTGKFE